MDSDSFGAVGFWIFIATIVAADTWSKARQKAEKHETLRRIVEKMGTIDEVKLKELFSDPPSEHSKPGYGYRVARVLGTIVMFIGAAIAMFFWITAGLGKVFGPARMFDDSSWIIGAVPVPVAIAILGLGIFLCSRFCEPPPSIGREPPAR